MRQSARRLGLVEIRIRGWCWSRRVGVSYRAEGQLSGLAVRFVEALKSCAPRLEEK
jgi:hypothetical protein